MHLPQNKKILPAKLIPLSAEGINSHLNSGLRSFYDIKYIDKTDSTNTRAKIMAREGCPEGTVVVCAGQTAGRGRLGRSFHSPRGSGVYLSIVLRPEWAAVTPELITTAAAVAVCEAAEACTDARPEIKWINDVLVAGKKVCGILTEGSTTASGRLDWAVLGAGINLLDPEGGFPSELESVAGALCSGSAPYDDLPDRVAAAFLNALARLYGAGTHISVPLETIKHEYTRRCTTPGKRITVIHGSDRRPADALRLDDNLRLVVRYEDGTEDALSSGEVSVRPL